MIIENQKHLFYQGWFAKIIEVKVDKINNQEVILGQGGYGTVLRGKMKIENINNTKETREVPIAIKRIKLSPLKEKKSFGENQLNMESIKLELSVYEQIKSKNIVQLYGSEQKDNHYYLYLELCDGNLLNCIMDENGDAPLKEEQAIRYFIKIFDTLQLLQKSTYERTENNKESLYHRDINVKNILIKKCVIGYQIKLCDFGIAQYSVQPGNQNKNLIQEIGTPAFKSPENFLNQLCDQEKNETWSLGTVLVCLLFGYSSFMANIQLFNIGNKDDHLKWISRQKNLISTEVQQLLFGLLQKEPKERMGYKQISESQCYRLYGNYPPSRSLIPRGIQRLMYNNFEYLTQLFINLNQNLYKQIPEDLLFFLFQHYKNLVHKQCQNYSGYYKSIDSTDLSLQTTSNINYIGIPTLLQKYYQFFQNIQLENETQNDDQMILFWRKFSQPNRRYQDSQRFCFLNNLFEVLDKLQVEQQALENQILELNKKKMLYLEKEEKLYSKKEENLNKKLYVIEKLKEDKDDNFNKFNDLISGLTQYFDWNKEKI
ncbi:unnamed protein product (macronuclear) [Paramecium tetraurelia]|uniref:Chromosome undetermined scaffold_1, whole genome shotgun sequence n=1 Tax=Paramecium tetraurelia TaxID=5888 RepID=Q6BGL8_PARTE|nr:UNC51-like kinase [Paramecium tetraurelia strain d4-2]XP_001423521.1 uncharacterized protein GSPATT00000559001 [Paramecium tetraurelia]CAH03202.1 UNC51-like kinase, putative [Paramecium tetraurelia]CAK56123.1 unnamed protein product [Paramecium tetraurelia]|eukprot:XP_001423521.1 hypothetical protein (macronuclear) [Paramecium tetraurelia strain d4-2]